MSAPPSRVAVIGDCPLFRRGLAQVVGAADDLECTVGAPSVDEAEDALQPGDVVLLDLQLPPAELAAVVHRLNARGLEVVVLCSELQRDIVPPMQAGARGCLSRQAGEPELLAAVRLVASGCPYVSAALALRPWADGTCRVTERERQILALLAGGETDHGIARRLGISEHTVHSHLDRLRDKVGSRRRVDLTRFALAHDIVPDDLPQQGNP
ncbi:LuxR C-terminal-related transcriptional regulator [Kitasatospora sp. KL5]|uniref:LuxR C-terminal-related transcriptional regulator n=1 Tax=Kitasatospora sp. KL5 TaxID=3425125 RepID=UPI003D6E54C7